MIISNESNGILYLILINVICKKIKMIKLDISKMLVVNNDKIIF